MMIPFLSTWLFNDTVSIRLHSFGGRIINNYGAVGGMRIGRGNRSTRRKPAPVSFCSSQIPCYLPSDRTRATAVGIRWLTSHSWFLRSLKVVQFSWGLDWGHAVAYLVEALCFKPEGHLFKIRCQETAIGDRNTLRTVVCVCQWSVKCNDESCVYKWAIHPLTNPNPVYSHTYTWQYFETFERLAHSLTHGAEPFLRSCQLCSYSRTSQHFMEPEGLAVKFFTLLELKNFLKYRDQTSWKRS
jgi:hypothetical protein